MMYMVLRRLGLQFASEMCTMNSLRRQVQRINKRDTREIHGRMKRLKKEMEDISTEEKGIREGQRQVREKFEAIEAECQQLRKATERDLLGKETERIGTHFRISFVFEMSKTGKEEKEKGSSIFSQIRKLLGRQQEPQE